MSSMGYCRFENTVIDMDKCLDELQEKGILQTYVDRNKYERPNIKGFIEICIEVAEEFQSEFEFLTKEDYQKALDDHEEEKYS